MTVESIDIRPGVNILGVLQSLNYKAWYALGEFVDNALGSYIAGVAEGRPHAGPLRVRITISTSGSGRVTVADNAFGIAHADFPRAFRAAEPPPNRSGLSEFGMGMKSAATWFAANWSVRTSELGDPVQRSVHFDMRQITDMQRESLPITVEPALAESHFTVIELTDLNHMPRGRTIEKIKRHLTSIYRQFLRDGTLELIYNDEPLTYEEVEPLSAPPAWRPDENLVDWRKPIDFVMSDGRHVGGFAGVRQRGSTSEAGFALFRRRRLIVGSFDEPYRPEAIFRRSNSYEYQRIWGELDLDGFEVSHTKDGFVWGESEDEFLERLHERLREAPLDLVKQAQEYRPTALARASLSPLREATEDVGRVYESRLLEVAHDLQKTASPPQVLSESIDDPPDAATATHTISVQTHDIDWVVRLDITNDESVTDWIEVGSTTRVDDPVTNLQSRRIEVKLSWAHPFVQAYVGPNGEANRALIGMGCALAIASSLSQDAGYFSRPMLMYANDVLRRVHAVIGDRND
ncbi:ATP-binding protein [Microbacterium sp. NPDC019599]|uniref:ATP-binding protein n=1 Tax=Microbacterium sp. NPDC019599 TaxID=3154690 RepID=UPI0033DFFD6D